MFKKYLLGVAVATFLVTGAHAATTSDTTATVTVGNSIDISTLPGTTMAIGSVDVINGVFTGTTSNTFKLKANADSTSYNVWLTVPAGNWDSNSTQVSAINDANATYKLPIIATLTGQTQNVSGDGTSAAGVVLDISRTIKANGNVAPTTAQTSGFGVDGTDLDGDDYTITITPGSTAPYKNIPNGTYSVIITVNTFVN